MITGGGGNLSSLQSCFLPTWSLRGCTSPVWVYHIFPALSQLLRVLCHEEKLRELQGLILKKRRLGGTFWLCPTP